MHPFVETISVAGGIGAAVVVTVIVLSLFYRAMSSITGGEKPDTIAVRGVLKKDTLATVHVSGHVPFERVRFIGFTNTQSMKTHLAWELNGMVILEDESKTQFMVRAKDIKMIIVPPSEKHGAATAPEI